MSDMSENKKSRFGPEDHRKAYEFWDAGMPYEKIADQPGMPSSGALHNWSRPDYDCDCKYHGWKQLRSETIKKAMGELDEYSEDSLVEREKKRLQFLVKVEKRLNDLIKDEDLSPPRTLKDAVDILGKIYEQQRLLKGQSTEIVEQRGETHKELNLQKVMNQLNLEEVGEDEFIEAVEDSIINEES